MLTHFAQTPKTPKQTLLNITITIRVSWGFDVTKFMRKVGRVMIPRFILIFVYSGVPSDTRHCPTVMPT